VFLASPTFRRMVVVASGTGSQFPPRFVQANAVAFVTGLLSNPSPSLD
jgi:hypothetical protein